MERPEYIPESLWKEDQYALEEWCQATNFEPVEKLIDFDEGMSYETDRQVVFRMKNGSYAHVHESHCSCYGSQPEDVQGIYKDLDELIQSIKSTDTYEGSSTQKLYQKLLELRYAV